MYAIGVRAYALWHVLACVLCASWVFFYGIMFFFERLGLFCDMLFRAVGAGGDRNTVGRESVGSIDR
jgi:hypothetical protein